MVEVKSVSSLNLIEFGLRQKPEQDLSGNVDKEDRTSTQAEAKKEDEKSVSKEGLQKQIDSVNQFMETNFTALKFNLHERSNRYFVQVLNKETDEVVREIPQEKFLDMVSSMLEYVGLVIDKRV